MKILLISHSHRSGGAEKCLCEAAIGLRGRGYDVHILIPSQGELFELLREQGFTPIVSSYPWWVHFEKENLNLFQWLKRIGSNVRYTYQLIKIIKDISPDIVLSNTLCVSAGAVAAFMLRKRHHWFIHEYGREDHGLVFDLGFYLSSKIISLTATGIFVNSASIREKFSQYIDFKKFSIVRLDIPAPGRTHPIEESAPKDINLLMVGQINRNKGQLDAIQAVDILQRNGYHCTLHIVGQIADDDYYQTITAFVREKGLEHNISFVNHTALPFDVIKHSSIGLVCSEKEAFGRVTIEYMKAGIPVIGANSGTTASLIRDGINGLLYELRNPLHLSQMIIQLSINKNLAAGIIQNARDYANANFNTENFIGDLLQGFHDPAV